MSDLEVQRGGAATIGRTWETRWQRGAVAGCTLPSAVREGLEERPQYTTQTHAHKRGEGFPSIESEEFEQTTKYREGADTNKVALGRTAHIL